MSRVILFLSILILFVQGCTAQTNALFTAAAQTRAATPGGSTAIAPSTVTPRVLTTRVAATATLAATISPKPTTAPSPSGGLTQTELKYRLLAEFGPPFFCDPDVYPVARVIGPEEVEKRVGEIRKNTEEFETILRHLNLQGKTSFTPQEQELIYAEHKKLNAIHLVPAGAAYQFTLRLGAEGSGITIQGTIDQKGAIAVTSRQSSINTCPICLAGDTRIDTPDGAIPVRDLRTGMKVWTIDSSGHREVGVIVATAKRSVPQIHPMVHLLLDDGRELVASAIHPTADGRAIGTLLPGDRVDGARVASSEIVAYDEDTTYDLLPAGGTGLYWANGILIGSTLMQ